MLLGPPVGTFDSSDDDLRCEYEVKPNSHNVEGANLIDAVEKVGKARSWKPLETGNFEVPPARLRDLFLLEHFGRVLFCRKQA